MSTTTIDEELREIGIRIERLRAFEEAGITTEHARLRRHLDVLRQYEASIGDAPDDAEDKLAELRARLSVAEHALVADLSVDWRHFTVAVDDELRSWDTFLERVQMSVATNPSAAREQAETAIGQVRRNRIAVEQGLAQVRHDASVEARERIEAARDQLERKADELPARIG
jgi:uncharacterized protein (DUF2267 family)